MPRYVPIETSLGYFYGRDCIYLDTITFEDRTTTVVLEGSINGNLCTVRNADEFVPYRLRFRGVLALRMVTLELSDMEGTSCFDEVFDSEWVRALINRDSDQNISPQHRHFVVGTYDDVFEIICENYEFEIQKVDA